MDTDIKMEIIYFCQGSDIKLEFGLRGEYPLRLLTSSCSEYRSFLSALKKAVARSEVIITVGGFFGDKYLPDILGRSIGHNCKETDLTKYDLNNMHEPLLLPDGAIPLISSDGEFGGCVIESGPQCIIMLTEEDHVRLSLLFELVVPYITEHYQFSHGIKEYVPSPLANDSEKANAEPPIQDLNDSGITTPLPNNNEVISSAENISELDSVETAAPVTDEIASINNTEKADNDNETSASIMDKPASPEEPSVTQNINTPVFPDEPNKIEKPAESANSTNSYQLVEDIEFVKDEEAKTKNSRIKKLHIIIACIASVLLLVLGGYFVYLKIYLPKHTASFYNRMHSLYLDNSVTLGSEDYTSKFVNLTNIDSNICGWISAPGTNINYPVVSLSEEKDESYYKTHLLDGTYSTYGTPYLLGDLSKDEFFRNYVIFANSTEDSTMFSKLSLYLDEEFCNTATTIQFDSAFDEGNWQPFSAFSFSGQAPFDLRQTAFASDIEYFSYINSLIENSNVELDTGISAQDPIIVLICESNDSSVVVAAKLKPKIKSQSILVNAKATSAKSNALTEIPASEATTPSGSGKGVSSDTSSVSKTVTTKFEQPAPVATVEAPIPDASGNVILTVRNSSTGTTVTGCSEDILAMIIEAEMGSGYPIEALKAQTVATYSWLITNGAANGGAPTVPMKTAEDRANEAVSSVLRQIAVYKGKVAQTYYYAISAGQTANSQDIWSTKFSYLQSVDSSVDSSDPGFLTTCVYNASDVAAWVQDQYGVDLSGASKYQWFAPKYDENGLYCTYVTIGQQIRVKGTELRSYLFTKDRVGYENVLRSSAYQISYNSANDSFTFTVKGYGHGIGMSQVGAKAYANQGWTYTQILQHYYPGIAIQ